MSTQITLSDVVTVCGSNIQVSVIATEKECRVDLSCRAGNRILDWEDTKDVAKMAAIFHEERVAVFEVICRLIGQARRVLQ